MVRSHKQTPKFSHTGLTTARIDTKKFVDELFQKIHPKAAAPKVPSKPPLRPTFQNAPGSKLSGVSNRPIEQGAGFANADTLLPSTASRKRTFAEHHESQNSPQRTPGGRALRKKQPRLARRQDRMIGQPPGNVGMVSLAPNASMSQQSFPSIAPIVPMLPPFDPSNDPMMFMMAMQAMMQQMTDTMRMQRCVDYDTKGYCANGNACPFKHGDDKSVAADAQKSSSQKFRGKKHDGVPENAHIGADFDKSNTTLIVDRIPDENLDEAQIQEFFSQFGKVSKVDVQKREHLAVIKFEKYRVAKKAYYSPKVVFDNRFIRVFWYSADRHGDLKGRGGLTSTDHELLAADEMDIDPEEFAAQQEKAQKAFEEKAAKMAEVIEQRKNLRERLEQHYTKMKDLQKRLAKAERKKTTGTGIYEEGDGGSSSPEVTTDDGKRGEKSKVQQALRDQLALLEAEAKSLGIDPEAPPSPYDASSYSYSYSYAPSPWRGGRGGSGGYLGRGGGRGGYYPSPTHHGSPARTGAVLRLDNRPRRIAISLPHGAVLDSGKDEALRRHLLTVSEFESIEQDPEKPQGEGIIVTYSDRWKAEMVIAKSRDIVGVGSVEMHWIPNLGTKTVNNNSNTSKTITPQSTSRASSSHPTASASVSASAPTKRRPGRGDDDEDGDDEMSDSEIHDGDYGNRIQNGHGHGNGNGNGNGKIHHGDDHASTTTKMGESHIFNFGADVDYDVASDDGEEIS